LENTEHLNKSIAAKIVSDHLGRFSAVPQTYQKYWLQRGWSPEEATLKARERKLAGVRKTDKIKSPFGVEHWLSKINPNTGSYYTLEEAEYKRNSIRPIRKEYWMEKGYPVEEAEKLANVAKDKNNRNGNTRNSKYATRTLGYYLVRGYDEETAKRLLSEAQATFSLSELVKKHGHDEGTRRWKERQDKWQATLKAKTFEEQEEINQRKVYRNGLSSISLDLFQKLDCPGARWGKKSPTNLGEMMIKLNDNKSAMIDFSLGNKLIEFYGDYWHANPKKYPADYKIFAGKGKYCTAEEKWKLDEERHQSLIALGYELLIVWESDYKLDPIGTIEKCRNFLNS
jgi:hypothetical protein